VKWEVREVCRRLQLTRLDARDDVWGATLNGHLIRLCLSGMVPSVARERINRFLNADCPDVVICSGLASTLRSDIKVGDVIVHSEDPSLLTVAERALKEIDVPLHVGPLVTVTKPALTPAGRRDLAAKSGAIAVDMESQAIGFLCRHRGIPCLAMQGVFDGIEDDLSPILGGFDIIQIPRLALRVLARPGSWPLATRLARHSYIATNNLGHGVWATLGQIGNSPPSRCS
jgi:nucleoside phosphorylase